MGFPQGARWLLPRGSLIGKEEADSAGHSPLLTLHWPLFADASFVRFRYPSMQPFKSSHPPPPPSSTSNVSFFLARKTLYLNRISLSSHRSLAITHISRTMDDIAPEYDVVVLGTGTCLNAQVRLLDYHFCCTVTNVLSSFKD